MTIIKDIKNQKINELNLSKALFYSFPLTFIIGNLAVTLNLLFFVIAALFLIKRQKLEFRFDSSLWLLIIFVSYLFISTTIQFQLPGLLQEKSQHWSFEENPIFKSIMLIRFPILIFLVDTLFYNKILNLKKFFLSSLICTSFVSFDVIFQHFVGFDLFGYKSLGDRNPGPFGNEWISGSYLVKFSFFSIFYVNEILKYKNFKNPLVIYTIIFHSIAIFLAGNRMPMILFLFGCFLIILFVKKLRIIFILSLIISSIIIFFIINKNEGLKNTYHHLFHQVNIFRSININQIEKRSENTENLKTNTEQAIGFFAQPLLGTSGHSLIYRTSIEMWKLQPVFGFGLKSFRIKCHEIDNYGNRSFTIKTLPYYDVGFACSNHSHNYYIELLAETGVVGTLLIIIFFLILLKNSLDYLKKYNRQINSEMLLLISVIIVVFIEMWPIKSTGSFFTTWNATFFWLAISLLMQIKTKR